VSLRCQLGYVACRNRPQMTYYVSGGTLNPTRLHDNDMIATLAKHVQTLVQMTLIHFSSVRHGPTLAT